MINNQYKEPKKGFVKLERLISKSFRYILTPEGFKEKSKKTIEYMKIYNRRTLLIKKHRKNNTNITGMLRIGKSLKG